MTTVYVANAPPVKNAVFTFYTCLVSVADTDNFKSNPTLAAGDITVSIDGGAFNNIGTLPTPISAGPVLPVALTAAEMNGNVIMVKFADAAGDEWQGQLVVIRTETAGTVSDGTGVTLAAGAITAAVVATGAIDADALATDAVTEIWSAASRTLTQSAAAVSAAVSGSSLNITIGATYSATISGLTISATWEHIYLTIKDMASDADANSIIQIMVTNPADAVNDGIMYLDKTAATVTTKAYGSLTIDQAGGTVTIAIKDEGTLLLPDGTYTYDIKQITSAGASTVLSASAGCIVGFTETRAV